MGLLYNYVCMFMFMFSRRRGMVKNVTSKQNYITSLCFGHLGICSVVSHFLSWMWESELICLQSIYGIWHDVPELGNRMQPCFLCS